MFHRLLIAACFLPLLACEKTPPPQPSPCFGCGGNNPVWTGPSTYSMRTYTSEDWDYWQYDMGDTTGWLRTYTSEDWDYWQFNLHGISGSIRTYTSEDWDNWQLTTSGRTISIRTYTSNDWDYWEIKETSSGFYAKMRTYTSNDFDYWEAYVGSTNIFDVRTYTSEDWDYWQFGSQSILSSGLDIPQLAAILFVPVYTSAIHQRGIDL
jgi:hypothetical protein